MKKSAPSPTVKKTTAVIVRPSISQSSLLYVPEDAVEGYQERIETGVEWTLSEAAFRRHKFKCKNTDIPEIPFSKAMKNKIKESILHMMMDEHSSLTLDEQWDIQLPILIFDNVLCGSDESKICFNSRNCITDNIYKIVKKAVRQNNRKLIRKELHLANLLRMNCCEMTQLDEELTKFNHLASLSLCGNFLSDIDASCLPKTLRSLELQANRIRSVEGFAHHLPQHLLYLGLSRNLLNDDSIPGLAELSSTNIIVLDISENDIYSLDPLLDSLVQIRSLNSLSLCGNPCSICMAYARLTLLKLRSLKYLDWRSVLQADRIEYNIQYPFDVNATFFYFSVLRIMSAPQPPKLEKGCIATFHVEFELPLLDSMRRAFLMYRDNKDLIEYLPPPEDGWDSRGDLDSKTSTGAGDDEAVLEEEHIYSHLTTKNWDEIHHFITFESNRVQWNKLMSFQEPTVRLCIPDLVALRDVFRSVITVRLVYTQSQLKDTVKSAKTQSKTKVKDKSSTTEPYVQELVLASIKCPLRTLDWTQSWQHFHWDTTLGSDTAMFWGDGDLSVIVYSQGSVKSPKSLENLPKQEIPEHLTCHFNFGIETLR